MEAANLAREMVQQAIDESLKKLVAEIENDRSEI